MKRIKFYTNASSIQTLLQSYGDRNISIVVEEYHEGFNSFVFRLHLVTSPLFDVLSKYHKYGYYVALSPCDDGSLFLHIDTPFH